MPEKSPFSKNDVLAQHLRDEARLSRPVFSERIHRRLRRAICDKASPPAPRRRLADFTKRWPAGLATAASLALIVVPLVFWQASARFSGPGGGWDQRPQSPLADASAAVVPEAIPETPQLSMGLDDWMNLTDATTGRLDVFSALASRRWGYLDRDARQALIVLADSLPVDVHFLGFFDSPEDLAMDLAGNN